jgi:hypothetical protein
VVVLDDDLQQFMCTRRARRFEVGVSVLQDDDEKDPLDLYYSTRMLWRGNMKMILQVNPETHTPYAPLVRCNSHTLTLQQ